MRKRLYPIILFTDVALILFGTLLYQRDPLPKETATVADVAADITAGCDTTEEKSLAVYRYMTRNFQYDYELCDAILAKEITSYTPDTQKALHDRKGICGDLAVLCAALLDSQGVEVKIVKGYYNGVYHAWNSIYDEEAGKWMPVDVTSDLWLGRYCREWPEFDAAQHTVSANLDYSALTPLTFGSSK